MTVRDLRDCLFEIKDQDQEINTDDICCIMRLWELYKGIDAKIDQLADESVSAAFIMGWQKEKAEILNMVRNYEVRERRTNYV